ncbi:hypothetical protein [Sphingomonas sp.]|uniref:hypothetical protein n=1 Tax=Sphingomonas sp. TaxID=28214 RepID=UPI0025D9246B|nr:hypothetical protein [Sphingomonas sp.]
MSLNIESKTLFAVWTAIGLVFYFLYGYRQSHVARGVVEVVSDPNLQPEVAERD